MKRLGMVLLYVGSLLYLASVADVLPALGLLLLILGTLFVVIGRVH